MAPRSTPRERASVKRLLAQGFSYGRVASLCDVSVSSVRRWASSGLSGPRTGGGRPRKLSGETRTRIVTHALAHPTWTRDDLVRRLKLSVSAWTVGRELRRNGVTQKKASCRPLEAETDQVRRRKRQFLEQIRRGSDTWDDVVSVDEASFVDNSVRTRGWGHRGKRCRIVNPLQRGRRYSLLCALATTGIVHHIVVPGSVTSVIFANFLRELKGRHPQVSRVVCDNASIHRSRRVTESLPAGLDLLFLPPYSPELQPIEFFFRAYRRVFHAQHQSKCHANIETVLRRYDSRTTRTSWKATFDHCWKFDSREEAP